MLRQLLDAAGLLDTARDVRGTLSGLSWVKQNSRFWLSGSPDGLPLPPLHLVRSSTGTSSLAWLLEGGALARDAINDILARNGKSIGEFTSILDFGCGCGRVIRQWANLSASLCGCDYNPKSIQWCRKNLPFASFEVNRLDPPLPYADRQFDLVYALSVFTHLPEPSMFAWLREMNRVLKPGGLLIISTHGERCVSDLTADQREQFDAGHAVVRDPAAVGTNRCGVYFSEHYIRAKMTAGFRLVDFLLQGAKGNPPQDLVLLQNQPAARSAEAALA